jgi:hypothetical protein
MNGTYKPIKILIKKFMHHKDLKRERDRLYHLQKQNYPHLFEDLIITGRHCILVDKINKEEESRIKKFYKINHIENKTCLPCFLDNKAIIYKKLGVHAIYHFALEDEDENKNFGIYANGLLVESCSIRICRIFSKLPR